MREIDQKGEIASIVPSGDVAHTLHEEPVASAPEPPQELILDDGKISEMSEAFSRIAGEKNAASLRQLLLSIPKEMTDSAPSSLSVLLDNIESKEGRRQVHFFFKQTPLSSCFTTETEGQGQQEAGRIRVTWGRSKPGKGGGRKSKGRSESQSEAKGKGDNVRFVLWKENLDTQVAIGIIAKALHTPVSNFGMAGTKDKRGCTSQFLTAYRIDPHKLQSLNSRLRSMFIKVHHPEPYCKEQLQLGALQGNEFKILMRNLKGPVESPEEVARLAEEGCTRLASSGFVNYFGLQRFGTGGTPTHLVGASLLRGEMEETCRLILKGQENEREDVKAARGAFSQHGDARKALEMMPKWATAERAILEVLSDGVGSGKNWSRALKSIPRTLKMMYLHAWQGRLWNLAASHRVRAYGLERAVEGDLVLTADDGQGAGGAVDESSTSSMHRIKNVHVVTKEEAEDGKWGIESVVLPLPGTRILYPQWPGGDGFKIYHQEASKDRIDLPQPLGSNQDKEQKSSENKRGDEFSYGSLGGDYRPLLVKPKSFAWELLRYSDPNDDTLMESEFEQISKWQLEQDERSGKRQKRAQEDPPPVELLGLKLSFILPASSYATMLIRELTRESTSKSYQSKLSAEAAHVGVIVEDDENT